MERQGDVILELHDTKPKHVHLSCMNSHQGHTIHIEFRMVFDFKLTNIQQIN